MRTIAVLADFSEISMHAAKYALLSFTVRLNAQMSTGFVAGVSGARNFFSWALPAASPPAGGSYCTGLSRRPVSTSILNAKARFEGNFFKSKTCPPFGGQVLSTKRLFVHSDSVGAFRHKNKLTSKQGLHRVYTFSDFYRLYN